ncbi:hypothetical protein GGI10_001380 [Coemansia sp. RSA 2530]|nr:hypothetical protein GGI10_001380 [Coemansia sp. RSA 2530]
MKAVTNLRTRMRLTDNNNNNNASDVSPSCPPPASAAQLRRRACTSTSPSSNGGGAECGVEASAFLSPPLTGSQLMRRAWTVGPRKLRGLHPSPLIVYVRENSVLVSQAMDKLYGTLVSAYNIDSKDIRVADVPTVFDLPSAVRRMGKDKQLVIVVALLARDRPWFDETQTARVREFMLSWSQSCGVPLIDGVLIDDDCVALARRIASPVWNIVASDDIGALEQALPDEVGCEPTEGSLSREETRPANTGSSGGQVFGQYLAHRAVEMFYIEHRGW